ncbi:hypothetical protein [uncultured Proteiniphilum sp.]|jgi:hypothetical protein|uniref:hypothetical protein n=1 Tax=uncultured Proteiniphilum sp. TaxID=497637 RepID=UPI002613E72A|nr:hypothetical protein [uncultured Proteiniphilum sp.]
MIKYKLWVTSLFILLVIGCRNNTGLKDFTYKYSMESAGNFKVEFQLNPDSSYTISQNNYFFDRFEGVSHPIEKGGILSQQEFERFSELISRSDINKMDDTYGFEEKENSDNSIVYIVELIENGESKYVSINARSRQDFPKAFTELIEYTNDYINVNLR